MAGISRMNVSTYHRIVCVSHMNAIHVPLYGRSYGRYGVATIRRLLKRLGLFAEYTLFYRALLQKRPIILRSLLIVATPYEHTANESVTDENKSYRTYECYICAIIALVSHI